MVKNGARGNYPFIQMFTAKSFQRFHFKMIDKSSVGLVIVIKPILYFRDEGL